MNQEDISNSVNDGIKSFSFDNPLMNSDSTKRIQSVIQESSSKSEDIEEPEEEEEEQNGDHIFSGTENFHEIVENSMNLENKRHKACKLLNTICAELNIEESDLKEFLRDLNYYSMISIEKECINGLIILVEELFRKVDEYKSKSRHYSNPSTVAICKSLYEEMYIRSKKLRECFFKFKKVFDREYLDKNISNVTQEVNQIYDETYKYFEGNDSTPGMKPAWNSSTRIERNNYDGYSKLRYFDKYENKQKNWKTNLRSKPLNSAGSFVPLKKLEQKSMDSPSRQRSRKPILSPRLPSNNSEKLSNDWPSSLRGSPQRRTPSNRRVNLKTPAGSLARKMEISKLKETYGNQFNDVEFIENQLHSPSRINNNSNEYSVRSPIIVKNEASFVSSENDLETKMAIIQQYKQYMQ
eukprot:TRINITY_DN686_c0_g1_i1.p1 TRINITY_DN686_c0_g1~~TRINITY_DN686_c0_g1_i1.p1  ORF type:complete len:430 (-),score=109.80 TRINITY_DN686_c0_g1_i1:35-1264(-)